MKDRSSVKDSLSPKKEPDKAWYLSLLEEGEQFSYEEGHLRAVLAALKIFYVNRYREKIAAIKAEIAATRGKEGYSAQDYQTILAKNAEIESLTHKLNSFKCFFSEPYFARMDVVDDKEGYNSYYIGKKGDVNLEIVDWRAPLAVRYYQKSRVNFTINEYEYRTVLRRALSVKNGKLLDFKNEYLSVKDVLTPEEIAGRDEELLFDPYLRSIIQSRKDDVHIRDIIKTICEQQFDIITRPERESFVLQGCAGSGKTMILLHRLSYLMYNNDALSPRDVLVITPSDSFNAFIDELSQVLELKRVSTVTMTNYFFRTLKNEGIDLAERLTGEREKPEYLAYLYSEKFARDAAKQVSRLYGDVYGLFTSEECREVAVRIYDDCLRKKRGFSRIKNASTRIRRAVLGELKENKEGGFYFTKPFRSLISAFTQVEDFLTYVLKEPPRSPDHFFRQFTEFYRCAHFISANGSGILQGAAEDLRLLAGTVDREIFDLKRYRMRRGGEEVYTYAERIERREELKKEAAGICVLLEELGEGMALFGEFYGVMRLTGPCAELGKCRDGVDIARWLYRETVKKYKRRYGMQGIFPSDGYALTYVLTEAGRTLTPRYGLVFIDEGQDVSRGEYALLKRIHAEAAFNVFGDLKQNITGWRGVESWESLACPVYTLKQNYRNTNEIVEFVSGVLDADMLPIGLHGSAVHTLRLRQVTGFFRGKAGLKAVIAKEEFLPLFDKRGYKRLSTDGKLSGSRINVMTVYESKGLEFSAVAVYDGGMSENEKYIAYTRALAELAIIKD